VFNLFQEKQVVRLIGVESTTLIRQDIFNLFVKFESDDKLILSLKLF